MSVKLEIQDFVNCRFHNLEPSLKRQLRKELRYFVPYAPHTPMYRAGYWDGYEHFFDQGGRTYNGLLEKVIPFLVDRNIEIELEDKRESFDFEFSEVTSDFFSYKTWPKNHKHEGEPISLRQHQVDALNLFFEHPTCIQELPTSSGKTIITATMSYCCEKYGNTIVIVPNKSLVTQTEEDFRNLRS